MFKRKPYDYSEIDSKNLKRCDFKLTKYINCNNRIFAILINENFFILHTVRDINYHCILQLLNLKYTLLNLFYN